MVQAASSGYYTTPTDTDEDKRVGEQPCEAGSACVGGMKTACTEGSTYQPSTSQSSCEVCSTCAAGKVMTSECTTTSDTVCGDCLAGTASSGGSLTECEICTGNGKFSDSDGASFCKTSRAGTKPSTDRTTVELCPKNHYSIGANDTCTPCPPGSHSHPGSSACERCMTGKYFNESANNCELCPSNTYTISGASDIDGCLGCPPGGHSKPGSGFCDQCLTGTYFHEAFNDCMACPSGKFSATGGSSIEGCEPCAPGFYSNDPDGAGYCSPCSAGNYTNSDQTGCPACPSGKFSSIASTVCAECESGKYNDIEGSDVCKSCPDYMTSQPGSTSCHCKDTFLSTINPFNNEPTCTCGPGTTLENGACVICVNGFYKSTTSLGPCTSCNKVSVKNAIQSTRPLATSPLSCMCSRGDYRTLEPPPQDESNNNATFIGQCLPCPEGTNCDKAGITMGSLPLLEGYWRSGTNTANVVQCYTESACAQSDEAQQNTTARNATFLTDSQCAEGHIGPICNVCKPKWVKSPTGECFECKPTSTSTSAGLSIVLLVGLPLLLFFLVKRKRAKNKQEQERASTLSVSEQFNEIRNAKKGRIKSLRTKVKILTSFYQVVTQMEGVLGVRFPPVFENFARSVSRFANLSFIHVARVDCMMDVNFYTSLLTMTTAPIAAGLLVVFISFTYTKFARLNAQRRGDVVRDTVAVLLTLSYLVFASVSTIIFETFNCKTFSDNPTLFLVADQSVSCETTTHKLWQIYAGCMMLFYPFGTPFVYSLLLWRDREVLKVEGERDKDERAKNSAFLWDQYSGEFWWFDIFDCARRLFQTSLLIFFFKGKASQIVFAMMIGAATFSAFLHWKPFEKESDNVLAVASQCSIVLTLFYALLTKVGVDEDDDYDKKTFGVLLIIINLIGIFIVVFAGIVKPVKKILRTLGKKHVHNAPLKGLTLRHRPLPAFKSYFYELVDSTEATAGWERIDAKYFGKHGKGEAWLEENNAAVEWRCSTGNGPIDQCRATFSVNASMEDVLDGITTTGKFHKVLGENADGTDDMHIIANEFPFPLFARDLVVRRLIERGEERCGIITRTQPRTQPESDARNVRVHPMRVRMHIHIGGYQLERVSRSVTKVIYVIGGETGGIFALDWIARKGGTAHLKKIVEFAKGLEVTVDQGGDGGGGGAVQDEEEGGIEMFDMTENPLRVDKEKEEEIRKTVGFKGLSPAT
ncbi:hypothetical protein TrCOL_g12999 [Triparma columacea]|uniref:TNFR-Cys domain-containing protein n=1 Tax=Triparma columacea TaxID=722753 RepID=A0A9W7GAW4_9STRA|nr:hypothetical protein TrCOL_g12999 [Triparma columacea]